MSQGGHAGRLLLAEYRDDLKRSISELAGALQPFDDNGLTALLCDVTAPAICGHRYPRRAPALRHQCMRLCDFCAGIRLG